MSINHRIGEHVTRYLVGRDYDVADVQKYAMQWNQLWEICKKILFYVLSFQYLDFSGNFCFAL